MNKGALVGFVTSNIVFLFVAYRALGGLGALVDVNSAIIVFGGTITATIFCLQFSDLKLLALDVKNALLSMKTDDKAAIIEEISALAKAKRKSESAFDSAVKTVKEPFLKDAASVLFWTNAEVSADDFRDLLETRAVTYYEEAMNAPKTLKTIAKFPPAFGMMGTIIGLIAMLNGLSDPNAKAAIGPAMAVAMMTTLYGIAVNNLLVIPLSENISKSSKDAVATYNLIIEGIMLIQARRPTKYIEEKLLSYLTLKQKAGPVKK